MGKAIVCRLPFKEDHVNCFIDISKHIPLARSLSPTVCYLLIAETKYTEKKNPEGDRVCFHLAFQRTVVLCGGKEEPKAGKGP